MRSACFRQLKVFLMILFRNKKGGKERIERRKGSGLVCNKYVALKVSASPRDAAFTPRSSAFTPRGAPQAKASQAEVSARVKHDRAQPLAGEMALKNLLSHKRPTEKTEATRVNRGPRPAGPSQPKRSGLGST